jgi:hypothetical protein
MDRNHENWRSFWTLEITSRTAVHQSGVIARVTRSPDNAKVVSIFIENTDNLDLSRWDLGDISRQAIALLLERSFERA